MYGPTTKEYAIDVNIYDLMRIIASNLPWQSESQQQAYTRLVARLEQFNAFGTTARDIKETYHVVR